MTKTLLTLFVLLPFAFPAAAQARKPNFIVIFCDDLGYADIGPFGSEVHRTPNIDQMAREGRKLTNFYSTCSVCTPSRASLMTGCYPRRVGLHENETGRWVLFPVNHRGINADEITLAELLRDQGYATSIVGKWHLGDQPEYLPTRHGFDSYFGIPFSNDMGKLDRPINMYPPTPLLRNETVIEMEPDQRYLTKRYTAEALEFIDENKDRPFFLYLPHSMPHWPQYATNRFVGQSKNGPWGDAVEEIDWSTGQILARLKKLGIDEHTLVVFTSDNGGATFHGAKNGPLRGSKGTVWEGGHRVCCVTRWPGQIPAGTETDQLAVTFDLLPTFARLAEAELPTDRTLDGRDIGGLLTGEQAESPHEQYFYYFRGHLCAVRSGRWKLFEKRRPPARQPMKPLEDVELYDLVNDIGERNNVADAHPDVVERLQGYLSAMRQDVGDGPDNPGSDVRPAGHVANAKSLTPNPSDELYQTDVFDSGKEGYHTYRIPSLILTPSSSLLAICEGRKTGRGDHGDLDLVLKRSDDFGASWGDLELIYEEGGSEKITIGNPCPVVDQTTGVLWLPFCRDNDDVLITSSTDNGKTWAPPRDITADVKSEGWGWYATGPGVGIQLTRGKYRGRLVIPCDHRETKDGVSMKVSHVFYSDDHGATWELGGSVGDHTDECQVVELDDGRLMMNSRNYWARDGGRPELGGKRVVSISSDGGESWGPLDFDETLIEPVCQASFIKHSNDTFRQPPFLFSNPASSTSRQQMTVRLSTDEGKTWKVQRELHRGPAAYSCLTVLPDRSIGCLYEAGEGNAYEHLVFARFTLNWLRGKE